MNDADLKLVLKAASSVLSNRVRQLNNEANNTVLAGKAVHMNLGTEQDRACYLADQMRLARIEVDARIAGCVCRPTPDAGGPNE